MTINRRDFFKVSAAAGGAVVAAGAATPAEAARAPKELPPDAVGMLYDSTLCIGCKACVSACKEANGIEPDQPEDLKGWNEGTWDTPKDLGPKAFNVIKAYTHGTMAKKDSETNGFAFIKRHCLHCVDPSCVSACPVSAMTKDAKSGIVGYNKDACIGCRYCVYACPFGVPKFEYSEVVPGIRKCEFCKHLQAEGKTPACCHVCPTGASLFGKVADLQQEAKRRLAAKPGEAYMFPRGNLSGDYRSPEAKAVATDADALKGYPASREGQEGHNNHGQRQSDYPGVMGTYQDRLYGEKELGGTQVMYMAGVPFGKLGLPDNVPDTAYAGISEGIQHTLYKGMIAPVALLGGLAFLARRNLRPKSDEGNDKTEGGSHE